ncbi:ornithine cyclodeaminase family protein [Nonomuraea endophytica]|uniref:Ornithine cyclodeaminase n=1 Tax=Nonomuraea endophytica TaxID=714136 RepID=A0A7W8EMF1_9ACTN|nr:ornithine cyclodeaminase family protein [Nonomuraea endophytica]MBB5084323.1 ornithine cyclodeaminase [Nonomuraea endophytica]
MNALPYVDAEALGRLVPVTRAVQLLEEALRDGLDPEDTPQRPVVDLPGGQMLLMPAAIRAYAGVKAVTIAPDGPERDLPRIQGAYLLFDGGTLSPLAVVDGIALTSLRTPAVSALAATYLAAADASTLVVFGSGPQAWGHVLALRAVRPMEHVTVVARHEGRAEAMAARCRSLGLTARTISGDDPGTRAAVDAAVAGADVIACCTTARDPLFPGKLARDGAAILAVGSHEPDAREVDDDLVARSCVVVESRASALVEAGDVIVPIRHGTITTGHLAGNLAELINGSITAGPGPRLFKSTGMAWQDLVVAAAAYEAWT